MNVESIRPKTQMTPKLQAEITPAHTENGRFHNYRGLFLLALLVLNLWMNLSFLVPLVMGAIFATVLYPLMDKMAGWKVSSTIKASVITLGFTFVILLPLGILLFAGVASGLEKINSLQDAGLSPGHLSIDAVIDAFHMRPIVDKLIELSPVPEGQLKTYAAQGLKAAGVYALNLLQGFVSGLPGIIFESIVIIFTLFFLLIDGKRTVRFIRENSIFGRKQTDRLISQASMLCYSTIVATLVSGAVQASLIGLTCMVVGTDGILLIVFISFIASFFPLFGTAPVLLFLAAQAFMGGNVGAGIAFLIAMPIVGTSDNVVRPYVLKGGAELHPLVGFVAAFGGLEAIGFYGLFIGPVVAGLLFALLPMVTRSYPRSAHS